MENEYGRYLRMADAIDAMAVKYDEEPFVYNFCEWVSFLSNYWFLVVFYFIDQVFRDRKIHGTGLPVSHKPGASTMTLNPNGVPSQ